MAPASAAPQTQKWLGSVKYLRRLSLCSLLKTALHRMVRISDTDILVMTIRPPAA
jgi:hypothetical protein